MAIVHRKTKHIISGLLRDYIGSPIHTQAVGETQMRRISFRNCLHKVPFLGSRGILEWVRSCIWLSVTREMPRQFHPCLSQSINWIIAKPTGKLYNLQPNTEFFESLDSVHVDHEYFLIGSADIKILSYHPSISTMLWIHFQLHIFENY
jgi:hypothetical protein